jgi:hypothetical protein
MASERTRRAATTRSENERIFSKIFRTNRWGSAESVSGPGAELRQTREVRGAVARLLVEHHIRTVVDAGCGDFNWMRHVPGISKLDWYMGLDVVSDLVERNQQQYGCGRVSFRHADITRDALPAADLVICRDCMVHLSTPDALALLAAITHSGSSYLLATTYPQVTDNHDTADGQWRPLNLQVPPFGMPEPIEFIDTEFTDNGRFHPGNGLGLWHLLPASPATS